MKLSTLFLSTLVIPLSGQAVTDYYRLSWRADPATTMVIGWRQVGGTSPVVHYGTVDNGTNYAAYTNTAAVARQVTVKGMDTRFARLTGLTPNTNYYFVIRDSSGVSARMWFKTANNTRLPFSFISGGDSRNNRLPRQQANKMVTKLRPLFIAFGGDFTDLNSDVQWQEWFADWQMTKSSDGRMYPIIATRGNHDDDATVNGLFDVPHANVYYALSIGGTLLRVYTLNSQITQGGTQQSWLSGDLAANSSVTWKFAQYHRPMFPHHSAKSDNTEAYTAWANLFYQYKMSLVEESDAHDVKRTWPLRPSTAAGSQNGFIRDDATGTVYVGEGCWGAPLRAGNDAKTWTRNMDSFNHINWNHVRTDRIELRSVKVANVDSVGQVSDSAPFTIPSSLDVWAPTNGAVITILPPSPGTSTTTGIYAEADAQVRSGSYTSVNYGAQNGMGVSQTSSTNAYESFVRFNLGTGIPGTITDAKVRLYNTNSSTTAPTHNVYVVSDDSWSESTITWASKPVSGGTVYGSWAPTSAGYKEFNVTNLISAENSTGNKLFSIRIAASAIHATIITYTTRENITASYRPQLIITYTP